MAITLIVMFAGTAIPLAHNSVDRSRAAGAASYVAGRLALARFEAVRRSAYVAIRFLEQSDGYWLQTYVDRNGALVQSFGGRFLARGGKTEAIAGPPPRQRTAIYMFESMEKMQAWRDSPQYKELIAIRDQSSNFRSFAVEGTIQDRL